MEGNENAIVAMYATDYYSPDERYQGSIGLMKPTDGLSSDSSLHMARGILSKGCCGYGAEKANLFIHGVVRRDYFWLSQESFPGRFSNERNLLVRWALAGDFEYLPKPLFKRTVYGGDKSRREGDPGRLNEANRSNKKQINRNIISIFVSVIRSPIISWSKKIMIVPILIEWSLIYGPHRISLGPVLKRILLNSIIKKLRKYRAKVK